MNIKNSRVLVIGLGISGIASIKTLVELGASVSITDSKSESDLQEEISQIAGMDLDYYLGGETPDIKKLDFIVKSPGVPYDLPILVKARERGIEVITDIELAYRISKSIFIAITGTNGKTTTTTLIGEIFKNADLKSYVVGNIGKGILSDLGALMDENSVFIVETSSFQLEDTYQFKPMVSLITNISPDHLNWHKSFENYVEAKKKVFKNQDSRDYTVLNYEDKLVRSFSGYINSNILFFSSKSEVENGVYLRENSIYQKRHGIEEKIMDREEIKIPGIHNLENILAAMAVCISYGIDIELIKNTISDFEGVEHRLEFVKELDGVRYYNDSKGTNPDASIKAIESIPYPITLIAGGMDKGSSFDDFVDSFEGRVKSIILIGETSKKIAELCREKGYTDIYEVESMSDAVSKAYEISESGQNVLLSPACASWDMYKSYEVRGREFKDEVYRLGEI